MTRLYPFVANNGFSATRNLEGATVTAEVIPRDWMQSGAMRLPQSVINANQWTSLNAMISYIAAQGSQSEFRIERRLADRFNIPNVKFLPAAQFDSAIRYLVDVVAAA